MKENIFLLAYVGESPSGYAKLSNSEIPTALENNSAIELCRIYCVQTMLGKGVGRGLMEGSISIAQKLKKDYIWLGVWEHNHRAIEFYSAFGFEKFGEHPFILGDDVQTDWLMKKRITNAG